MDFISRLLAAFFWLYVTHRINLRLERKFITSLDVAHTGASVEWAESLREVRGRHARLDTTYA